MSGKKFDGGKARYDLIPVEPLAELARIFTIGAEKYGVRNWERGLDFGRVFAAMMRHSWAWWRGETQDPEDGQHHLASVAWGALVLMQLEQTKPDHDDRPGSVDVGMEATPAHKSWAESPYGAVEVDYDKP